MKENQIKNNQILKMKSKVIKINKSSNINEEFSLNIPSENDTIYIHFKQNKSNNINTPSVFLNVKSENEQSKIEQNLKTNEIFLNKISKISDPSKGSLNSANKITLCESPDARNSISSIFKLFHNRNINSNCDVNSFDIPTDTNNSVSSLSNSYFLNYNLGITNYSIEDSISMDLNNIKVENKNNEEEIIFDINEYTYNDELKRKSNIRNKSKLNFDSTEEYKINEEKNFVNRSKYKIKNF